MSSTESGPYPGAEASVWQILGLAHEYYNAAMTLFQKVEGVPQTVAPLSRAPARLCAIHAIELYLNAFLMHEGVSPAEIRRKNHSLAKRSEYEVIAKLKLRKRTTGHLITMSERREYLVSRYGPELVATHSELNRLTVTLVEVMTKVGNYLASATYTPSHLS